MGSPSLPTLPHVEEQHQEPARAGMVDVDWGEKPTESPAALEEQQPLDAANQTMLNF